MAANPSAAAAVHDGSVNARSESKREKKRQLLTERLQQLSETFIRTRDSAYREQLQKIQLETNLVMRVDPYTPRPSEVLSPEEKEKLAQEWPSDPATSRSLLDMAGPRFQQWLHNIEDLAEHRDYEITMQKAQFDRKMHQHRQVREFKVQTAKREHQALASTVRDRLMNAILAKKLRLNKEKEALEISDASALLLHPNQFSLTNPSSPGGPHGKRTTRLRREMEEMPGFSDGRKRKRNANEDDGSPAPQRRTLDSSNTTPVWQGDRLHLRKTTGPVYSIDKLFTDRELSLNYQTSSLAAHKYLLRHGRKVDANGTHSPADEDASGDEKLDDDEDSNPSAPAMERQVSHATRSTRGGAHTANFYDGKVMGVEGLTNFELPSNLDKLYAQEPRLPPLVPTPYNKAKPMTEANGPQPLPPDDIQGDMMAMSVLQQYDQLHGPGANLGTSNGGRRVLEAVAQVPGETKYVAFVQGDRPNAQDLRDGLGMPAARELPTIGASPMSRQSSVGGVAMSRQGTGGSTRGQRRRGG